MVICKGRLLLELHMSLSGKCANQQEAILQELVVTERTFLEGLQFLMESKKEVVEILRTQKISKEQKQLIENMLGMITKIFRNHRVLYQNLIYFQQHKDTSGLAKLIKKIAERDNEYSALVLTELNNVANDPESMKALKKLPVKDRIAFLDWMRIPAQRQAKYPLLFKELSKQVAIAKPGSDFLAAVENLQIQAQINASRLNVEIARSELDILRKKENITDKKLKAYILKKREFEKAKKKQDKDITKYEKTLAIELAKMTNDALTYAANLYKSIKNEKKKIRELKEKIKPCRAENSLRFSDPELAALLDILEGKTSSKSVSTRSSSEAESLKRESEIKELMESIVCDFQEFPSPPPIRITKAPAMQEDAELEALLDNLTGKLAITS